MLARESGAKAGTCRWSIDERYRITTRLASSGLTIDACTGLKPPGAARRSCPRSAPSARSGRAGSRCGSSAADRQQR